MYHKLGRPKRTVKAEIIVIHEDGCEPFVYKLDNRGNIILKSNEIGETQKEETTKDEIQNTETNNTPKNELNCQYDLSNINYYLNKKTFPVPSINDYETDADSLNIMSIQQLLVI